MQSDATVGTQQHSRIRMKNIFSAPRSHNRSRLYGRSFEGVNAFSLALLLPKFWLMSSSVSHSLFSRGNQLPSFSNHNAPHFSTSRVQLVHSLMPTSESHGDIYIFVVLMTNEMACFSSCTFFRATSTGTGKNMSHQKRATSNLSPARSTEDSVRNIFSPFRALDFDD